MNSEKCAQIRKPAKPGSFSNRGSFQCKRNLSRTGIGTENGINKATLQRLGTENTGQYKMPGRNTENQTRIPENIKTPLEQLSGFDLSGVRVHYNSARPAKLNSLAYAQGKDIYLGPGQEKHLPHEGWHVVQQMQGRVRPTMQTNGVSINNDKYLEHEADIMGEKARQLSPFVNQSEKDNNTGQKKSETPSEKKKLIRQSNFNQHVSSGNSRFNSQSIKTEQGISSTTNAQLQSTDETDNEQVRADYDALQPDQGVGDESTSASQPSGSNLLGEGVDLSQLTASDVSQLNGCTPSNTAVGNNALSRVRRTRESWRSHVSYRYTISHTNNHLNVDGHVFAKVYYGLWLSWETIDFDATIDLTCQSVANKCEIAANERGGSVFNLTHSPAGGAIAIQTNTRSAGSQMALTVRVGGSVGASSSVSAGVGPVSAGVSFPDASISHQTSMGVFIYTCSS